jgi:hypothetical protein
MKYIGGQLEIESGSRSGSYSKDAIQAGKAADAGTA